MEVIGDTLVSDVHSQTTLYPLKEEVLEAFLEKAKTFRGKKWKTKVDFPKEWGVECVERLPEGRELWLLRSENREWTYLVTTSGFGTQRILDVLPVAISIVNQRDEELETDNWQTLRLPDGQFLTTKEYEWIHSVSKATKQDFIRDPEKFHRKTKLVEQFLINDQGYFEQSEIVDTLPDYNAVVFYFNPADKPEMWDATIPQLQAFCEENGILYEEVSGNFNRVTIRDFELTFAMETDITPYIDGVSSGMVMMRKNEVPKTVNFGSFEYMQMEIRRYFKVRSDLES
jgi:autonomous glycyl radical cofactor GrcA